MEDKINKKSINKKQKGITLIALIITIVIMLILATVTINVAINGKLFDTAKEAVDKTDNKVGSLQNRIDELMGELDEIDKPIDPPPTDPTIEPGDKVSETTEYEDTNGDIATIPGGFTVSGAEGESTIEDGLVIYLIPEGTTIDWTNPTEVDTAQRTYDQFVWIPIKNTTDANAQDINDMYICQAKTGSNGNCNITVQNEQAKCTTHNSTQMAGRLYVSTYEEKFEQGYTEVYTENTGLREPDVVTGNSTGDGTNYDGSSTYLTQLSSILGTAGYNSSTSFKESLQTEYNEIVKSVYENQGFYIGRYETSGMVDSNTNATVKSVAGTTEGISRVTWYRMYAQQKKYAENKNLTSVKSSMIQGAAYDQVMKFVENGNEICRKWKKTRWRNIHNKRIWQCRTRKFIIHNKTIPNRRKRLRNKLYRKHPIQRQSKKHIRPRRKRIYMDYRGLLCVLQGLQGPAITTTAVQPVFATTTLRATPSPILVRVSSFT